MGGEEGEARVLLRSRADKATAKQNTASERFRPTGVQEGATGMPVGLHSALDGNEPHDDVSHRRVLPRTECRARHEVSGVEGWGL